MLDHQLPNKQQLYKFFSAHPNIQRVERFDWLTPCLWKLKFINKKWMLKNVSMNFILLLYIIYVGDYFLAGLLQGNQDRYSILRIKKKAAWLVV